MISEPEIKTLNICYEHDFIILGSDGLFDFVKDMDLSMQVRKCMKEDLQREEIPARVAEWARKAALDSDDISCIIIFL